LKYYQVVAQVAHQVVTMITELAALAAAMDQKHCKDQCMDLTMATHIQSVPQAHQTVVAAVHVT
jgi:hypothetical protein